MRFPSIATALSVSSFLAGNLGCQSLMENQIKAERVLSQQEMKQYNLVGIVSEARICPTRFNPKTSQHEVLGQCEIVTCEEQGPSQNQLICRAQKEKSAR